jgi:hypothetical protein
MDACSWGKEVLFEWSPFPLPMPRASIIGRGFCLGSLEHGGRLFLG